MSQGSWNLWKHPQWAVKLSLLALWALWSITTLSLRAQRSCERWIQQPKCAVLPSFTAFISIHFLVWLSTTSYPDICLIPSKPDLWLYVTFQCLPVSNPCWLYFFSFKPYKVITFIPHHISRSVGTALKLILASVDHLPCPLYGCWAGTVLPLYKWFSLFSVLMYYTSLRKLN